MSRKFMAQVLKLLQWHAGLRRDRGGRCKALRASVGRQSAGSAVAAHGAELGWSFGQPVGARPAGTEGRSRREGMGRERKKMEKSAPARTKRNTMERTSNHLERRSQHRQRKRPSVAKSPLAPQAPHRTHGRNVPHRALAADVCRGRFATDPCRQAFQWASCASLPLETIMSFASSVAVAIRPAAKGAGPAIAVPPHPAPSMSP